MARQYNGRGHEGKPLEFKAPTPFLIEAELRRLEKQDACPHGDITYFVENIYECICGKRFTTDDLDELEWALEDLATEISDQ